MTTLLTILACFAGVFAFAFGTAGFLVLVSFEPPKEKRSAFLFFLDHLFAGGLVSMLRDVAHNWSQRVTERRLLCLGLACGLACIILVTVITRIS
jgi:hypothetical protein